jgi:coproporphyrinogen III oxidase-like Fe-S oxidoreductase
VTDPGRGGIPPIHHMYLALPDRTGVGVEWARALGIESRMRREEGWLPAPAVRSVHVGGGCASRVGSSPPPRVLGEMEVDLAPGAEWTVEFDPGGLTRGLLDAWTAAGANRISLRTGPLPVLEAAGRVLTRRGPARWNADVEFGGAEPSRRGRALRRFVRGFKPPHLSLSEAADPGDPDEVAEEYLAISTFLVGAGYRPWEFTSFALPGHVPRHMRAVWRGQSYLGLGPGAHSFRTGERVWNLESWEAYFSRIGKGADPTRDRERPGPESRTLERLWSGLRLAEGLALDGLPPVARQVRDRWVAMGWARDDPSRLRLNERGWLLLDTLAVEMASRLPAPKSPPLRGTDLRQP